MLKIINACVSVANYNKCFFLYKNSIFGRFPVFRIKDEPLSFDL